jgi:carbon-monoxide dehydrogenase medium subunit
VKPARFAYMAPTELRDVHRALDEFGDDCKVLAGGQSLGPLLNLRLASPRVLVDLERIASLSTGITEQPGFLRISAMTRHRCLELDPTAARLAPLLSQAVPFVAHRTIRNRGTLGGSLAHADPAAELPAVVVASGAVIIVESTRGQRRIDAGSFFKGFFTTALGADEVIVAVDFPRAGRRSGTGWAEFAPRRGDFAVVGVAVRMELDEDGVVELATVACAGVSDTPWRASAAEDLLSGERPTAERLEAAAGAAARAAAPRDDSSGSTEYRKHLVELLTRQALTQAVALAMES